MARILIIDDDPEWLTYVQRLLQSAGHEAGSLSRGVSAVSAVEQFAPDLVITDILMPGLSGGMIHAALRSAFGPELPIVVCSSTRLNVRTQDSGTVHCTKQEAPDNLLPTIAQMLESA